MTKTDTALGHFREGSGFNCAHSVLLAFAPDFGMDKDLARLAAAFGGGLARSGQTCGAVTGALMVLGLKHGITDPGDQETRDRAYALAKDFLARYRERRGTVLCRDLLGYDVGTTEGRRAVKEQKLWTRLCTGIIRDAVEILEKML